MNGTFPYRHAIIAAGSVPSRIEPFPDRVNLDTGPYSVIRGVVYGRRAGRSPEDGFGDFGFSCSGMSAHCRAQGHDDLSRDHVGRIVHRRLRCSNGRPALLQRLQPEVHGMNGP